MKIVSSFLPPVTAQHPLKNGVAVVHAGHVSQETKGAEVALEIPQQAVGEIETVLDQARSRREKIHLKPIQGEPLSFNNLRALTSYQSIAAEPIEIGNPVAYLDIIV